MKSLRFLFLLPALVFVLDLLFSPDLGLRALAVPILKISSGLHIFLPIVTVFALGIMSASQKRRVLQICALAVVVNLLNFFLHLPVTILAMTLLGWVHFFWNYYHFGSQAQGVFKFFSFGRVPEKFRRFEAWAVGFTYFVLIPYAVVADNARLQSIMFFQLSQSGNHLPLILTLTALQLIAYLLVAAACGLRFNWNRLLALSYMIAPPLIALTNSLSVRLFLYLLPHQLSEIYFQLKICRGLLHESATPVLSAVKLAVPLIAGVAGLYLAYNYPQIRAALSGGPMSWAEYRHSSPLFHWGSALFIASALVHFYADGIIYRFRDPRIRERVLPYLQS